MNFSISCNVFPCYRCHKFGPVIIDTHVKKMAKRQEKKKQREKKERPIKQLVRTVILKQLLSKGKKNEEWKKRFF